MKPRLLAGLTVMVVAAIMAGLTWLGGPYFDFFFVHYPGAGRVESEHFDTYYLEHGWITRDAAYQTTSDIGAVVLWYSNLLAEADVHDLGTCVSLRQTRMVPHVLRTITVQLCRVAAGTRILVNEAILLSP